MYNPNSSRNGGSSRNTGRRPGAGTQSFGRSGGRSIMGRPGGRQSRPPRKAATIDPQRFINQAIAPIEEVPFVPEHSFADFGFGPGLNRNIEAHGYVNPTPIQDGSIPSALEGRDVLGLANTGTGKTAAFLLPLLERRMARQFERALILAPTRELAQQIDDEFRMFTKGLRPRSAVLVGGMSIGRQLNDLRRNPDFLIATPGRLKDLMDNHGLDLSKVEALVLDEADRMLDMGFIRDIKAILAQIPNRKQTLFFSATMTPDIEALLGNLLHDPVTVSVVKGSTSAHVEQDIVAVDGKDEKFDKLAELLAQPDFSKVLVFGETKHGVQRLADNLNKRGYRVGAIHGNKSQSQRQRALDDFKAERTTALIATDVAARGIDIPSVTHVINFDLPNSYEDYVHRIGRTGRAGRRGSALTFVPSSSVRSSR